MKRVPRQEYPRPDFERCGWQSLNGEWDFSFDDDDIGRREEWYRKKSFQCHITVPFVYQCKASGINEPGYHPIQWYSREFSSKISDERTFLCFGAVDYRADIWIDGQYIGFHEGGYTPFEFDITDTISGKEEHKLTVRSEDFNDCSQPRGKQYWKPVNDRCWYTASSGIWQSVWIEQRPEVHIDSFQIIPDIDTSSVTFSVGLSRHPITPAECAIVISKGDEHIQKATFSLSEQYGKITIRVSEDDYIDEIHYWTPETPSLYNVELNLIHGVQSDNISTYFGMRKIEIQNGHILLNNKPLYQRLVLDQAYWEESLLTAPSDQAFIDDITLMKEMGFNGVRLHQKIEDPRFYYWADRLGLLVWAEMPSTYSYNRQATWNITRELHEFIERDRNHPSIICWVPLNESWGVRNIYANTDQQRFAVSLYHLIRQLDPSRLINTNDGWEQVTSDICGIHDYIGDGESFSHIWKDIPTLLNGTTQGRMIYASGYTFENQPILVTEFGGIAFSSDMEGNNWGYANSVEDETEFLSRLRSLIRAIREKKELQGFCYTQLTDVMQEVNGLLSINRRPKCSLEDIRSIIQM